jgi:hypothetical protein
MNRLAGPMDPGQHENARGEPGEAEDDKAWIGLVDAEHSCGRNCGMANAAAAIGA